MNKRKFLSGFMQLSVSSFVLRGVGMAYRVVLQGRIGTEGMGLYQLIMTVYGLFSMVSCAGLSVTVSRLCAEKPSAQRSIVGKSCLYALLLGALLGLLLYFSADFAAGSLLGDARAADALKWIAPSLPMMGISAALRGYFLAIGDVARPTIAQVAEQFARVSLVLGLLYGFRITDLTQACAVILFGATTAELMSMLLHVVFARRLFHQQGGSFPASCILQGIFPILLGCAVQSGMQTVENLLIPLLLKCSGASPAQSLSQYGMLSGMVLPVLLFPAALPMSMGTLLLPEVAHHSAMQHAKSVQRLCLRALRVTLGLNVLFSAIFLLFGQMLMEQLYHSEPAGGMLRLLTPLLPLLATDALCDMLLKGLGKQTATMIIETADGLLRIAGVALLVPEFGMAGYVSVLYASAAICCLARLCALQSAAGLERSAFLKLLFFHTKDLRGCKRTAQV